MERTAETMNQEVNRNIRIPPWLIYGLVYFLAAQISLLFTSLEGNVSPIWFASGIALGGILLHGYAVLPGILLGALATALLNDHSWMVSGGLSIGILLEAIIGYWLMVQFSAPRKLLIKPVHFARFLLFCVAIAPLFSAIIGSLILWRTGTLSTATLPSSIGTWWVGDSVGILILTPLLMTWRSQHVAGTTRPAVEWLALAIATLLVCGLLFGGYLPEHLQHSPITFMLAPLVVWCVLRFDIRTTSLLTLFMAVSALAGTTLGYGPFSGGEDRFAVVFLQIYFGTICATALIGKVILDERQISQHELKLAAKVIQHSPDAIVVTDKDGRIVSANPAFINNTGYSPGELLGKNISLLDSGYHDSRFFTDMWNHINQQGEWSGEIWNRNKSGTILPEWLNIIALENGDNKPGHYLGIYSDVARQQQVMDRIHRLAYYDILTKLPNRQLFNDRLDQALKYAGRNNQLLGLLFIDLDRFKNINDTLGHSSGDKALALAAKRMQECVRQTDTLARLGGDEFTVILQDVNEDFDTVLVAEKILQVFKSPIQLDQHELYLTPSIGIALFPDNGSTVDDLIKFADTAMYRAKELGGNNYQLFDSNMSEPFHWNLEVETALRRAIENSALKLLYQPQFDLHTGAIVGLEGLARWNDPELGIISPGTFIRVAENTGLIHQLGEQVLTIATQQAIQWGKQGITGLRISVNVATLQLKQQEFFDRVKAITGCCRNCGNSIELEITETSLMENAEFMEEVLVRLADIGLEVAVDDFGTGYSSLSYLKRLPIDLLKIDQSFVRDLPSNSNDTAICRAIIAMAHSLNLRVLAEGVETEEQMQFLRKENCDEMQGFLYSKPISADEISEMIRQCFWHTSVTQDDISSTQPKRPAPPRNST
ncbi:EAL domain-containing protein [Sedimenticola selenatireducens]|uniref:cyclic-guanylate-specific phosphodiesterase n=1 Tax=Sedimenticola selenatireducens TaxID=191960 RepID=A0A2N6CY17_9GAMM|nr:EAL domain-containing protein [Sedimenticola selenatireducens]PLX62210.1 MAG: diguanylate cyclase [Sedimenticola selenatireducens]